MRLRSTIINGLALALCWAILLSAPMPCRAAETGSSPGKGRVREPRQMEITFRQGLGLLSLDLRDAEIADVLMAVAEKTGIGLTLGEGISGKVSLVMKDVSLEEALAELCANRAIVYDYDSETKTYRMVRAGAFAATAGVTAPRLASASESPKAASPHGGSPQGEVGERLYDSQGRLLYRPGELLVRFKEGATGAQIDVLNRSLGSVILDVLGHLRIYRLRLREGLPEKEAMALYKASDIVDAVERHALRYPMVAPNDPYFVNHDQWNMEKIGMPAAWDMTVGNRDIAIAVIDTGIDLRHPDLAGNIWMNPAESINNADDDGNGLVDDAQGWDFADSDNDPTDTYGHGTHMAGLLAGLGNNGRGIAGIGWRFRLMPLKVMSDDEVTMLESDIIAAIDYAIAKGVRIVNCSFGGEATSDQFEYEAFLRLRNAGILAVCAAGNRGIDNDTDPGRIYPASYDLDNIISVAASTRADELLPGSNYGRISVDLMAPGEDIWSAGLCPASSDCDSYSRKTGSSMAAAHVTGVAGLILSRNPGLGYAGVKSIILDRVENVPAVSDKLVSAGRLDAAAAVGQVCRPGDVNGDAAIGLDDVILLLRIASGMDGAPAVCRMTDVNSNDRLGMEEAIYGVQILSGLRQ